jgi:outer membrane protein TolC
MTHTRFHLVPLLALLALLALLTLAVPGERARAAPVRLTPRTVVQTALKHNLGLKYERLAPELTRSSERVARATFDTTLFGNVTGSGDGDRLRLHLPPGFRPGFDARVDADLGVRRTFVTGTRLEATLGGLLGIGSNGTGPDRLTYQGGARLYLRHPLLLGSSKAVNKAAITTARLERSAAHQQLRRKAEQTAVEVLKAYWDLHAALASLRIQEVALKQSQKTLSETRELIKAQKIAASEAVEAMHQVKTEERATLLAQQTVSNHRDRLARLMGLTGPRSLITPAYVTVGLQGLPVPTQNLKDLHATALRKRGDYRALQITQKTRKVDLGVARHALLPSLDLVGSVGVYGNNNPIDAATDPTLGLVQGRVAWTFGLVLEIPLSHREAKAKREIADLRLRQAAVSLEEKELLISEELKVARRGLKAAQALVTLAATAVKVAEIKLSNEMERYRSGKTPARLVALVRSDLVRDQLVQQQALATLHKALVDLWAAAGTLIKQVGGNGSHKRGAQ